MLVQLLPVFFALLGFAGIGAALLLAWNALRSRQEGRREKLGRRLGAIGQEGGDLLRRAAPTTPAWMGDRFGPWVALQVKRAGRDEDPRDFVLRAAAFAFVGYIILFAVIRNPGPARVLMPCFGLVLGVIPFLALRRQATKRSLDLSVQLPDGLDLIARTLRAGHAFGDALRISANELPQPLSRELGIVAEESRLGRDPRESLTDLVLRNPDNFDLRLFVSSIMLQRETGGNLIEMLDNLSKTIRERIIFGEKVEALTAEVRFSAVILTAMPFLVAFLILMIRPEYMSPLFQTTMGRIILGAAIVSLSTGALIMRRLSHVET